LNYDETLLKSFEGAIQKIKKQKQWDKSEIVTLFHQMIPDFGHKETGKYLDSKM
jgi:hypothetical protein